MTIHAAETFLKHHRHARNIEVVATFRHDQETKMRRVRDGENELFMVDDLLRGVYVVLEVIHGSE